MALYGGGRYSFPDVPTSAEVVVPSLTERSAALYAARLARVDLLRASQDGDPDCLPCCGASGRYGHGLGCPELLVGESDQDDLCVCQGCGLYASYREFGREHVRKGEPCGIYC